MMNVDASTSFEANEGREAVTSRYISPMSDEYPIDDCPCPLTVYRAAIASGQCGNEAKHLLQLVDILRTAVRRAAATGRVPE
jgi:hypothetical protein